MISVDFSPGRLNGVRFSSSSPAEADLDDLAWDIIAPLIRQADRRLRRIARTVLKRAASSRRARP